MSNRRLHKTDHQDYAKHASLGGQRSRSVWQPLDSATIVVAVAELAAVR